MLSDFRFENSLIWKSNDRENHTFFFHFSCTGARSDRESFSLLYWRLWRFLRFPRCTRGFESFGNHIHELLQILYTKQQYFFRKLREWLNSIHPLWKNFCQILFSFKSSFVNRLYTLITLLIIESHTKPMYTQKKYGICADTGNKFSCSESLGAEPQENFA